MRPGRAAQGQRAGPAGDRWGLRAGNRRPVLEPNHRALRAGGGRWRKRLSVFTTVGRRRRARTSPRCTDQARGREEGDARTEGIDAAPGKVGAVVGTPPRRHRGLRASSELGAGPRKNTRRVAVLRQARARCGRKSFLTGQARLQVGQAPGAASPTIARAPRGSSSKARARPPRARSGWSARGRLPHRGVGPGRPGVASFGNQLPEQPIGAISVLPVPGGPQPGLRGRTAC